MGIEIRRNRNPLEGLVKKVFLRPFAAAVFAVIAAAAMHALRPPELPAEEPGIAAGIGGDTAEIGETVRLELLVPNEEAGHVRVVKETFPEGIEVVRGPFVRPRIPEGGTIIEYDLAGRKPGRYILGPFAALTLPAEHGGEGPRGDGLGVVIGGSETGIGPGETNALALFVGEKRDGRFVVPVSVSWNAGESRAYVGSPVYLVLWAEMLRSDDPVFEVAIGREDAAIITPVDTSPPRRPLRLANGTFYKAALRSYLFTPFETGTVTVPEAAVRIEGGESRADPVTVEVLPLPGREAGAASGDFAAVGDFLFENRMIDSGGSDKIILEQRCSGTGNLPFLSFPEPAVSGLILFDREEERAVAPEPEGYSGWRLRRSVYLPTAEERQRIVVPEAKVIDPESGEERTVPAEEFTPDGGPVSAPESQGAAELQKSGGAEVPADEEDAPRGDESLGVVKEAQGIYAFILRRVTARRQEKFLSARADLCGFEVLAGGPEDADPEDAGHAAGRAAGAAGKLCVLRRMHRMHPMDRGIVRHIRRIEADKGIGRSVPVFTVPHPDIFAYFIIGSLLLGGFSVSLSRKKRRGANRPGRSKTGKKARGLAVLALLLFVLNSAAFGITCLRLMKAECIVRDAVSLLKVPAEDSSGYRQVKEGAAFELIGRWENFVQVKLGSGTIGWLPLSAVLVY
jgi:hypothetical protein